MIKGRRVTVEDHFQKEAPRERVASMRHLNPPQLGLPIICVESRQAYQALKSLATHKTDRNDARGLAHLRWRAIQSRLYIGFVASLKSVAVDVRYCLAATVLILLIARLPLILSSIVPLLGSSGHTSADDSQRVVSLQLQLDAARRELEARVSKMHLHPLRFGPRRRRKII